MIRGKSATPLAQVRGLGSAKEGGEHWLSERFTSIALVLLSAWLLASLMLLPDLGHATLVAWLSSPLGALPMAAFVVVNFIHGLDGMKVVIDDYIHHEGNRIAMRMLATLIAYAGAGFALFSLANLAFGSQ